MKKTMIISLCFVSLLVTGCGVAKLENGEEVVASVDSKNITANDLYGQMKDSYARNILIDMVDKIILDKLYKTDDTMTSYVNDQVDYYKEQLGDNFLSYIKSQIGLNSEQELYNYLLMDYKRNEATKAYVADTITDAEINTYYKDKTVGDIKASHILIKPVTTDTMTDAEKTAAEDKALAEAKEIITKLNDGGDFAALAKEYSDDGSATSGGDLGWFNKGTMVASFEDAAYALEKGKYTTTPVKSDFGYHIILKTDIKDKASLEDSKKKIIESITTEKLAAENSILPYQALKALREEHKLDIQDSELSKQYNDYMNQLINQ